jgi:Zn-dependent protease with chaperone function
MAQDARDAIRSAYRLALAGGQDELDSVALVAAMLADPDGVAAQVLAQFSLSRNDFLAATNPGGAVGGPTPGKPIPMSPDLRLALESAAREAIALRHVQVTTGHLLLGVAAHDGPAARALATLGAPGDLVRAAVLAAMPPGPGLDDLVAAVPLPPPAPAALPLRLLSLRAMLGLVLAYAVAATVAVSTITPADLREVAAGAYILVAMTYVLLLIVLGGVAAGRLSRRLAARAPILVALPPLVDDVVRRHGVRRLETRIIDGAMVHARAYRLGGRAWVVLSSAVLLNAESAGFVVAHEIGHVLRADSRRRRLGVMLGFAMVAIVIIAPLPLTALVTALMAVAVVVGDKWLVEFGADDIAVRWVGIESMRAFVAQYRQRTAPTRRLRRARGLLTHPPVGWRLARAERLARRAARTAPAAMAVSG